MKRLRKNFAAKGCALNKTARLNASTSLEGCNTIFAQVDITSSRIGYGTYIGSGSTLSNCSIGRFCSIAENVHLVVGRHPLGKMVTTSPLFYKSKFKIAGQFANALPFDDTCPAKDGFSCSR